MSITDSSIVEVVVAVREHGSYRAAMEATGLGFGFIQRRMAAAAERGLLDAVAPKKKAPKLQPRPAPEPMKASKKTRDTGPAKKAEKPEKPEKPLAGGYIAGPETKERRLPPGTYAFASVQNNTYAHPQLMASMKHFLADRDATLMVSSCTYNSKAWSNAGGQTKSGKEQEGDSEVWFDPDVQRFVCDRSVRVAPDLLFCAELDINPTAVDPLSGLDSYCRESSGIVGHNKVAMKSLASMKHEDARFMFTTGSITQRNFIQRKAGQKADFHFVFGFLCVEVDADGAWFARQVVACDDGSFQDLDRVYTPQGVRQSYVEAIVWGDIHREKCSADTIRACWQDRSGPMETLKPRHQIIHDLTDFAYRNHHNIKSPYFLARMQKAGTESVEAGMDLCADFLKTVDRPWCETVVAESNHDQAFLRWLEEADGHRDPVNALYWHTWNARVFKAIRDGEDDFLAFEEAVREKTDLRRVRFLREDESFTLAGIELSLHGHRGPNGSRGSPRSYRQMGRRAVTAHTHSAGITDGVYTAGVTGDLDMGYNRGPSSWSRSHVLIYPNGKRAILTQRGDRWRGGMLPANGNRKAVAARPAKLSRAA